MVDLRNGGTIIRRTVHVVAHRYSIKTTTVLVDRTFLQVNVCQEVALLSPTSDCHATLFVAYAPSGANGNYFPELHRFFIRIYRTHSTIIW